MSIASKLAFLLALALAAIAVAAAAAFATDSGAFATAAAFPNTTAGTDTFITPAPATRTLGEGETYSGTETTPGTLVFDNGTVITCQDSDISATVIEDGTPNDAIRLDTLTFGRCMEPNLLMTCTVVVTTLPAFIRGDFDTPRSNWQATGGNESITFTCAFGTVVCEFGLDNTLRGTIGNTTSDGTITVEGDNNVTVDQGSVQCGSVATWTQSWTITTPDPYTITT